MDTKYLKGKIYTITNINDNTLVYVGSTTQTLRKRLANHIQDYNRDKCCGFYKYVENWEDWKIELYEKYPCENREQLNKKEGSIIRLIGTLNSFVAGRTYKDWVSDNVNKVYEINKKWRDNNVEKLKEKRLVKITCDICGFVGAKNKLLRHQRTQKCINFKNLAI